MLRLASLEDTLRGRIEAWSAPPRRQSKCTTNLGDSARLVEAHPHMWGALPAELPAQIEAPA